MVRLVLTRMENAGEMMSYYKSIIGMLGLDHTGPGIKFSVRSQCARFSNSPKKSHEISVKRIGRYLLGYKKEDWVLNFLIN